MAAASRDLHSVRELIRADIKTKSNEAGKPDKEMIQSIKRVFPGAKPETEIASLPKEFFLESAGYCSRTLYYFQQGISMSGAAQ